MNTDNQYQGAKDPQSTFSVKSLALTPMPKTNRQYHRSLTTNLTDENHEKIFQAFQLLLTGQNVASSFEKAKAAKIAPLLQDFSVLTAEGAPVEFPRSINDVAAAFVLEVEQQSTRSSTTITHYVAGYIEGGIPTSVDQLNPYMPFFINSIHTFRKTKLEKDDGIKEYVRKMPSLQVLHNLDFIGFGKEKNQHLLRPSDVIVTASTQRLYNLMGSECDVVDLRTVLSAVPVFAEYSHNDPTIWSEQILGAKAKLVSERQKGNFEKYPTEDELTNFMFGQVRDEGFLYHPFIRALNQMKEGLPSSIFELRDLARLDSEVMSKVKIFPMPMHDPDVEYDSFKNQDFNTVAASYIANSIPAIMAKFGIRSLELDARNFFNPAVLNPRAVIGIGAIITDEELKEFLEEVRVRVMDVISIYNDVSYQFSGSFDLFGTSTFGFEFDRKGVMEYITPTFANGVFSPQIAIEKGCLDNASSDFDQVFDILDGMQKD